MKKIKVNEIFSSLQGEGRFAGVPAIFVRLSGCNLKCSWCDTQHNEGQEMAIEEILEVVEPLINRYNIGLLVITGGEPTLCSELQDLLFAIREKFRVCISIETNGTNSAPLVHLKNNRLLDWVTVSPKFNMLTDEIKASLSVADEIKVVLDSDSTPEIYNPFIVRLMTQSNAYIQPCEIEGVMNLKEVHDWVLEHPGWKMGLQMHKFVKIR